MQILNNLIDTIKEYDKTPNFEFINKVYNFANKAHEGQRRQSGEPYITHPLETAVILAKLQLDYDIIAAGILHDVPEDTDKSINDISKNFGEEIAYLVDGITKLSKVHYKHNMEARQVESLKKMFIHSAKDPRVILIKLADRLHNLRTLDYIPKEEKRKRIAKESLEIFVPIADLLGIYCIKNIMEDICFRHLHPSDYTQLTSKIEKFKSDINQEKINLLKEEFKKNNVNAEFNSKKRTLYNMFKLIKYAQSAEKEVFSTEVYQIEVDSVQSCYNVLGMIHQIFQHKPGTIKDYISSPRINGYQSLQTTVFGEGKTMIQFHIETKLMSTQNYYGVSVKYLNNSSSKKHSIEKHIDYKNKDNYAFLSKVTQLDEDDISHSDYIDYLKSDLFQRRIYVFTPNGDSIDLPINATGIDFAYAIHSDLGNKADVMEVNNYIMPITTKLSNGDTVHIITDEQAKGPNRTWLKIVKTSNAKKKIKEFLKKSNKEQSYNRGLLFLNNEFKKIDLSISDIRQEDWKNILTKFNCSSFDSLVISISEGEIDPVKLISFYIENHKATYLEKINFVHKDRLIKNQNTEVFLYITGDSYNQAAKSIQGIVRHNKASVSSMDVSYKNNRFTIRLLIEVNTYTQLLKIINDIESENNIHSVERQLPQRKKWLALLSIFSIFAWLSHPIVSYLYVDVFLSKEIYSILSNGFLVGLVLFTCHLKDVYLRNLPNPIQIRFFWTVLLSSTFLLLTILYIETRFLGLPINLNVLIPGLCLVYLYAINNYLFYKKFYTLHKE